MFYAFSVMLTGTAAGAEFSTTALSLAYGGFVMVGGGLAFLIGRRIDRFGVRTPTLAGFGLGALGLLAFGRAAEPWQVVAASWLMLGPAGALTFYEPAFVAVDQWFGPRHRARALAVLTLVGGLAGPLFLPGTERLVVAMGWRGTTVVLAAVMVGAGAVNAVALPRGIPPRVDRAATGTPPPRIWRDPRFLLFTGALACSSGGFQAVLYHRIAVFEEAGYAVAAVAVWAAASSILSLPGRYAGPYLAERYGGIALYATATVFAAAGTGIMVGAGAWRMPAHFITFGITFGALLPIRAVVMARWYSGPAYGRVMGAQWSAAAVAGGLMPAVVGALRDAVGGYGPAMLAVTGLFAAAATLASISGHRGRRERGEA